MKDVRRKCSTCGEPVYLFGPEHICGWSSAKSFHDTYERLAPSFGYETRAESAKPWDEVPDANKQLMAATCATVLQAHLAEVDRLTKERDALVKTIGLSNEATRHERAELNAAWQAQYDKEKARAEAAEQRISELTSANEEKARKIVEGIKLAFWEDKPGEFNLEATILAILNGGQQ